MIKAIIALGSLPSSRCRREKYGIFLSTEQKIRQDKGYPMDNLDEQDYSVPIQK